MAGTDRVKQVDLSALPPAPAVVLVDPQLGENIGMVARAMLNCGLSDLRLVRPRDGWPSEKAREASSGAVQVIDAARVFETTAHAIADLQVVLATTAREREQVAEILTPRAAAGRLHQALGAGLAAGILFGAERAGLTNEDVALADAIVQVPLNPGFSSLNLAQAVLLVAYEWYCHDDATAPAAMRYGQTEPAARADLINYLDRLEAALDDSGFFKAPEMRPTVVRNIRAMYARAGLTDQEVRTLLGVLSALLRREP